VVHDIGALDVEDQEVLAGFNEVNDLPGEEPGEVEQGPTDLDDAVAGDSAAADPAATRRPHLLARPGRDWLRHRLPSLKGWTTKARSDLVAAFYFSTLAGGPTLK
jgi:hypothetical protein